MWFNQHHLELLKKGDAATWNAWRQSHPVTIPKLSGADLEEANLTGVNLSASNLKESPIWRSIFFPTTGKCKTRSKNGAK
jgi:uncharacterized protein YjbI with pentapeptide repeats